MCYAVPGIPLCLIMFQSIGERMNTIITWILRQMKKLLSCKNRSISQTNLMLVSFTTGSTVLSIGAAVFSRYEDWGYLDSFYYCFITLTTIGFGDFVALQRNDSLAKRPDYVAFSLIFILFGLTVVSSVMNLLVLRFLTMNTEDERRDQLEAAVHAQELRRLRGDVIWADATNIGTRKHSWSSSTHRPPLVLHSSHPVTRPSSTSVHNPPSPCSDSLSFHINPGSETRSLGIKLPGRSLWNTVSSWFSGSRGTHSPDRKSSVALRSNYNSTDGTMNKSRDSHPMLHSHLNDAQTVPEDLSSTCPISASRYNRTNNAYYSSIPSDYADGRIPFMGLNDSRENPRHFTPSEVLPRNSPHLDDGDPLLSGSLAGTSMMSAQRQHVFQRHPCCYIHGNRSWSPQNTNKPGQTHYLVMHRPNTRDSWYGSVSSVTGDIASDSGTNCCSWWYEDPTNLQKASRLFVSSSTNMVNSTITTSTNSSSLHGAEPAEILNTGDAVSDNESHLADDNINRDGQYFEHYQNSANEEIDLHVPKSSPSSKTRLTSASTGTGLLTVLERNCQNNTSVCPDDLKHLLKCELTSSHFVRTASNDSRGNTSRIGKTNRSNSSPS